MALELTRAQEYTIRAWTGSTPDTHELQARWDDLSNGDVLLVARQVLQERLGTLTASPASWAADGDYSENNADTIKALQQQISDLSMIIDGNPIPGFDPAASTATGAALYRDDRERLFHPRG